MNQLRYFISLHVTNRFLGYCDGIIILSNQNKIAHKYIQLTPILTQNYTFHYGKF